MLCIPRRVGASRAHSQLVKCILDLRRLLVSGALYLNVQSRTRPSVYTYSFSGCTDVHMTYSRMSNL
eukprot:COSAG05_NODE_2041_length_3650_cov_10.234582_2_plen_67_part_00